MGIVAFTFATGKKRCLAAPDSNSVNFYIPMAIPGRPKRGVRQGNDHSGEGPLHRSFSGRNSSSSDVRRKTSGAICVGA